MHDAPICPECGRAMVPRTSRTRTYANGDLKRFWGCPMWPKCRNFVGAHPDGTPTSVPADEDTRAARQRVHNDFDRLWKGGDMTRKQAYQWLQRVMGLSEEDAHIGRFSREQCEMLTLILALRGCYA